MGYQHKVVGLCLRVRTCQAINLEGMRQMNKEGSTYDRLYDVAKLVLRHDVGMAERIRPRKRWTMLVGDYINVFCDDKMAPPVIVLRNWRPISCLYEVTCSQGRIPKLEY